MSLRQCSLQPLTAATSVQASNVYLNLLRNQAASINSNEHLSPAIGISRSVSKLGTRPSSLAWMTTSDDLEVPHTSLERATCATLDGAVGIPGILASGFCCQCLENSDWPRRVYTHQAATECKSIPGGASCCFFISVATKWPR